MNLRHVLRSGQTSFDKTAARWAVAYALLQLAERLVLVGVALSLVRGRGIETAIVGAMLGAIVFARAAVRTTQTRRVQAALHRRAVDKLLQGDLLAASASAGEDTEAIVLEGIFCGVRLFAGVLPELAADAIATVAVIAVLAAVEPTRLLVVGGAALAMAGLGMVLSQRVARHEEERAWNAYQPVIDGLVATIGARLEIVSNGVTEAFRDLRYREVERWEGTSFRATMLTSLAGRLPAGIAVLLVASVVLLEQSFHHELSTAVFAHAALFGASLPAFAGLGRNVFDWTRNSVRFAQFAALLDAKGLPAGGGALPPSLPAPIVWRNVSMRYEASPEIALSGIDLNWAPGEVLILRGPNGSGKSTLLRSLLAVAPLEGGTIDCKDVELMELDLGAWRGEIGYLAQRPFLPARGSVGNAFAIVAPEATEPEIARCLARVDMLRVLERRAPSAPLEVDVGALSVGQRQRLALARVLANDKALLLLDEPDANLDRAGVELLISIVREWVAQGRMVAIAAHTEEIVALGGRIVTLENGRIV